MNNNQRECFWTLAIVALVGAAMAAVAMFCGCATKTTSVDGTGVQANQYTGLTVFSGSMVSVAQGMEFLDVYEDVSTSWWNFGRYNYKRRTTWASSSTNEPPKELAAAFGLNVRTEVVYAPGNATNGGSVVTAAMEAK